MSMRSPMTIQEASRTSAESWLSILRFYLIFVTLGNLFWETAQLPLYTIWREGTARQLAIADLHCTAGDVLIATASIVAGLLVAGHGWPDRLDAYRRVALAAIVIGVTYTVFSEWLNIVVRRSWAYSELMPVIPLVNAGLSPVLQWMVVPLAGFWFARRGVGGPAAQRA